MKKVMFTEILWLIGLLLLAFLISAWIISNKAFDVSAHDAYNFDGGKFLPQGPLLFTFFIVAGFVVYLTRTIFFRFKILSLCMLFAVFNCLLLGTIEVNEYSLYSFLSRAYWEYNAPLSTTTVKGLFYGGDGSVLRENHYLFCFKVFLILTLCFTSFMIGYYFKSKKAIV